MNQFPDFPDQLASIQDDILEESDSLATVRARLLSAPVPEVAPANRAIWMAPLALVAAAAAVGMVVLSIDGDPSLTASSNGRGVAAGDWISADGDTARIDFSDGTVVTLEAGSQARIVAMDAEGARILLEKGCADLDVVHTDIADWSVEAGPFSVAVTGTHFQTDWGGEVFAVRMAEGSVFVTGPVLGAGKVVSGTEALRVDLADGRLEITNGPPEVPVVEEPVVDAIEAEPEAVVTPPERPVLVRPTPPVAPVEVPEPAGETWQALYESGKFADAVALATADGLEAVLNTATATDLYRFADAARLAQRNNVATSAYVAYRSRFPGTNTAAEAAFLLGQLSFDRARDYQQASRWFGVYLQERPEGTLAEKAMGLLMQAHRKGGDKAATRDTAKRYLDRYPSGSYAATAKNLAKKR